MSETVLSETRATGLRGLLIATCVVVGVLVVIGALLASNGYGRYSLVVLGSAVLLGSSAGFTLWALPRRGNAARRGCIVTAVLLILVSLPLVSVVIGIVTVVGGIGLLVVLFAPEQVDR